MRSKILIVISSSILLASHAYAKTNTDFLTLSIGGSTIEHTKVDDVRERGTTMGVYAQKSIANGLIYSGQYDGNLVEDKNDIYEYQEHMARIGLDYNLTKNKDYDFYIGGKVGYWYAEYKSDEGKSHLEDVIYGPSVTFVDNFGNWDLIANYGYYLGFEDEGMHEAKINAVYKVSHNLGLGLEYRYQNLFEQDRHSYFAQARFYF